ncbi:hypothetical protein D9611_007281 [Ephemerocybe angulata]|uniref:Uncharacterized protein n=1 Tax=Ephemerocybe angulata TaxID=980116 RepID=A0A8H5FL04_9AGAR|nr:hypothetical protein D9611_007281 [Tulosesus angulatus]
MSRYSKEKVIPLASEPSLEERLASVTKERDDLAAKYALLIQEKGAQTTLGEAIPGPKDGSNDSTVDPNDGSDAKATILPWVQKMTLGLHALDDNDS